MDKGFLQRYLLVLALLLPIASKVNANTPPTVPGNLSATTTSDSVTLSWDASIDDKRVRHYRVYRNQVVVDTTRRLSYTINGLASDTSYRLDVEAYDGKAYSFLATISATTQIASSEPEPSDPVEPVDPPDSSEPTEPVVNCKGRNKRKPECQNPPAEEPPVEEPPAEEPPTEDTPTEDPPEEKPEEETPRSGEPPADWQVTFEDNFDGSGDISAGSSSDLWRFETMTDALHRAGNPGMDEFGNTNVEDYRTPTGKRWSAWYDNYNTDNAYRSVGNLVMQGLVSDQTDPTRGSERDDYDDKGVLTQYRLNKLYTTWIDTWGRVYDNNRGMHITDPNSPNRIFRYGYFEARVNFSEMKTPGFRLSLWLMPASTDSNGLDLVEDLAFDDNGDNGVEMDIFEYEFNEGAASNRLQMAVHGGGAGSSSTNLRADTIGVNLEQGWHTIGFLWQADRLEWTLNGEVVKTITNPSLIPDVYSYMIVSREMNSGVKTRGIDNIEAGDVEEKLPYRPRDPGMYAENIWEFRDRIATDRALIDYIRVWQP